MTGPMIDAAAEIKRKDAEIAKLRAQIAVYRGVIDTISSVMKGRHVLLGGLSDPEQPHLLSPRTRLGLGVDPFGY